MPCSNFIIKKVSTSRTNEISEINFENFTPDIHDVEITIHIHIENEESNGKN